MADTSMQKDEKIDGEPVMESQTPNQTEISTTQPVGDISMPPEEKVNKEESMKVRTSSQMEGSTAQPSTNDTTGGSTSNFEKTPAAEENKEQLTAFPRGVRLVVILIALCLVNLLVSIDQSIVSTAIPRITDEFHNVAAIGWYGSAYLLSVASCQMLFGRLYTLLPVKTTFLASIIIFEVGSIVCGAAPTSNALIVGRTVAGLGGAGIWSGILIIIAHCIPLRLRPAYAALDSITFGIGSVTGPLIGGAFTDGVSWRWCFYINAPLGGVAALAVAVFMPKIGRSSEEASSDVKDLSLKEIIMRFDPFGLITLVVAVVCLLLALQYGGSQYAWSNGRIIALLVLFGFFTILFILTQYFGHKEHRAIPQAVVLQRTVIGGSLYFFCMGGCFMLLIYYLPVWFQAVQGASAFMSGVKCIPLMLAYVFSSIISGLAITKIGYYSPFIIGSSILMAIGAGCLSTLTPSSSAGKWIGYQVMFGLGLGFGCDVPFVAVQTVLPLDLVPSATAVLMFTQTLGATMFISIAQSVFTNNVIGPLATLAPGVNPLDILNGGITNLKTKVGPETWPLVEDALNRALDKSFQVAAIMATLTIIGAVLLEHKSVKSSSEDKKE